MSVLARKEAAEEKGEENSKPTYPLATRAIVALPCSAREATFLYSIFATAGLFKAATSAMDAIENDAGGTKGRMRFY